jgi:hypothetical protein
MGQVFEIRRIEPADENGGTSKYGKIPISRMPYRRTRVEKP